MARWDFRVPEADYRAFGYEPDYDKPPWKESYNASKGREEARCSEVSHHHASAVVPAARR